MGEWVVELSDQKQHLTGVSPQTGAWLAVLVLMADSLIVRRGASFTVSPQIKWHRSMWRSKQLEQRVHACVLVRVGERAGRSGNCIATEKDTFCTANSRVLIEVTTPPEVN